MPWRAVEDMHWRMGRAELAQRAGVKEFVTTPDPSVPNSIPVTGKAMATSSVPAILYSSSSGSISSPPAVTPISTGFHPEKSLSAPSSLVPDSAAASTSQVFEVHCDLIQYLKEELDDFSSESVYKIITFTVDDKNSKVRAATCYDYVLETWPEVGTSLIDCFSELLGLLNKTVDDDGECFDATSGNFNDFGIVCGQSQRISMSICRANPKVLRVEVRGQEVKLRSIVHQLAWLACTLRTRSPGSTYGPIAYSEVNIFETDEPQQPSLVQPKPLRYSQGPDKLCWSPMLRGSIIAHGFPLSGRFSEEGLPHVPDPAHGKGLDISFDLMLYLIGSPYPLQFNGTLILKGYSSVLLPVSAHSDYIQWHLESSDSEDSPIELEEVLKAYMQGSRPLAKNMKWDSVQSLRHFVGYCPEANVHLGSSDADYGPYADSHATIEGPSLASDGVNLSLGSEGMGIFVSLQIFFHYPSLTSMDPFQDTLSLRT